MYVFRAVRNAAIDQVRRRRLSTVDDEWFIFEPQRAAEENLARDELQDRVAKALRALSDGERESIVQHLYCDLTFREIGKLCGVSINTASSWYYRGLAKLKRLLGDEGGRS